MWAVMRKFGFGEGFISWVQLLYQAPKAVIREAGKISPSFDLNRGTRQGCPLSPLLFALAIEPMAALIRSDNNTCGFQYGSLQEKLMLYTDDTMLMLGDITSSIKEVMAVITGFGTYSGLIINWSKSSLMLLDVAPDSPTLVKANIIIPGYSGDSTPIRIYKPQLNAPTLQVSG